MKWSKTSSTPRPRSNSLLFWTSRKFKALFSATDNIKHKAILMIIYSAGLRISEASRLKITDIDSKRMTVRVEARQRRQRSYTILAETTLNHLRQYWRQYHPKEVVIRRSKRQHTYTTSTIYQIFCEAKNRAGITKTGERAYPEACFCDTSD